MNKNCPNAVILICIKKGLIMKTDYFYRQRRHIISTQYNGVVSRCWKFLHSDRYNETLLVNLLSEDIKT